MVEVARLESVYTLIAYRGFESLPLRQNYMEPADLSVGFLFNNCLFLKKIPPTFFGYL